MAETTKRSGIRSYNDYIRAAGGFGVGKSFLDSDLGQFGQKAGKLGQLQSVANFAQRPTLRSGITAGITYGMNANPYYAGINALTGGMLDKGVEGVVKGVGNALGFKSKPKRNMEQERADLQFAQQDAESRNAYRKFKSDASREAQMYRENMANYRRMAQNLRQQGIASREIAGLMGGFASQSQAAQEAAKARLAANLSARGMSPSSGIGAGAMAGLEGAATAATAAQMTAAQQAALNRAMVMDQSLFASDVAGLQSALGREQQAQTTADELALRNRALQMQQQQADAAARQAEYQRRSAESMGLGNFLVQAYGAYNAARRPQQQPAASTPLSLADTLTMLNQLGLGMGQDAGTGRSISQVDALTSILNQQYPAATAGQQVNYLGSMFQKQVDGTWRRLGQGVA